MKKKNLYKSNYTAPYSPNNYLESAYNNQLGFGSWLKDNAGAIGTVAGAALGTVIAPGIGTELGASLGGMAGGALQTKPKVKQPSVIQNGVIDPLQTNLNNQSFKCGGKMRKYPEGGDISEEPAVTSKVRRYKDTSSINPYKDPFTGKDFYVVTGTEANIKRPDVFPIDTNSAGTNIMYGTYTAPRTKGAISEQDYVPTTFRTFEDDNTTKAFYPSPNMERIYNGANPYKDRQSLANYDLLNNPAINPYYKQPVSNTAVAQKAYGGDITQYNGYRHENGGLALGNTGNEVEDGETRGIPNTSTEDYIFSDRLKPIGSNKTFAEKSKSIDKKYSLRPWDKISQDAKERELTSLMEEHELVRNMDEAKNALKEFKNGGSIHIKPSHRGRFTEYKERTGKTTQEALHSSDPHVRKMAQFAVNAAKWKHEEGGNMYAPGGNLLNSIGTGLEKTAQFAAKNPELINIGIQGANMIGKQRYINNLKSNYVPIQGVDYRPITNQEELNAIDTGYRGAENASANYTDSGSYLNRMLAIDAAKTNQKAAAMERLNNTNAQGRMQTDMYNKGIEQNNNQVRMAEKDALDSMKLGMYDDWNNYLTGSVNTLAKKKAYNDMMAIEGAKYSNYEMYEDPWGNKKFRLKENNNTTPNIPQATNTTTPTVSNGRTYKTDLLEAQVGLPYRRYKMKGK